MQRMDMMFTSINLAGLRKLYAGSRESIANETQSSGLTSPLDRQIIHDEYENSRFSALVFYQTYKRENSKSNRQPGSRELVGVRLLSTVCYAQDRNGTAMLLKTCREQLHFINNGERRKSQHLPCTYHSFELCKLPCDWERSDL